MLKRTQVGLDHCKVAEVSEFCWTAVSTMRSQLLSMADPNMHKRCQEVEVSLRKQVKHWPVPEQKETVSYHLLHFQLSLSRVL